MFYSEIIIHLFIYFISQIYFYFIQTGNFYIFAFLLLLVFLLL